MKTKRKICLSAVIALICSLFLVGCTSQKTYTKLPSWQENCAALTALQTYVGGVTDKNSEYFIPVEDRIAVFDLDGTLYGEKAPYYAIWQTVVHRILYDETYTAPDDVRAVALQIEQLDQNSSIPDNLEKDEATAEAKAFAGMTQAEYDAYVKTFLQTAASGFNNLKLADAFYQPMLELIQYLQDNDFTVYICSGTDRFWVRSAIDGHINIPEEHVIGMDVTMIASGQGTTDGLDYVYQDSDEVIRGDRLLVKNVKMNKVSQIAQEIGRQPVLAFGNSSGDSSMCAYVMDENPYKSMAFMVLADDTQREYGNVEKAEKMRNTCTQNGWTAISMKDDWKTIYGDGVTKLSQ